MFLSPYGFMSEKGEGVKNSFWEGLRDCLEGFTSNEREAVLEDLNLRREES